MAVVTNTEFINQVRQANPAIANFVPEVNESNIDDVYKLILNNTDLQNPFITTLVNVIAIQKAMTSDYVHPFHQFKRGFLPLGATYEEMYTDVAKEIDFSILEPESALGRYYSDIGATYHCVNRDKSGFAGTVNYVDLRRAFKSETGLADLANTIVKSLYQGDEKKEYELFKSLLTSTTIKKSGLPIATANPLTNADNAKAFVKSLRTMSNMLTFLRDDFNCAMVNNSTNVDRQVLFIRADVEAAVGVDVLAYVFQMSEADYTMRRILIDDFGDDKIYAILTDDNYFIQYDTTYMTNTQYNAMKNWWTYFLHHYGIYSTSLFSNAIVFREDVTPVTLTVTAEKTTAKRGDSIQCSCTSTGYNAHKWSVSGNTSSKTNINMNGLLVIGSDETSKSITVTATPPAYGNKGTAGTKTITIS